MSFAPYPEYVDSGIPWLGRYPACWRLKRAKEVFVERVGRSKDGSEELLSVSAYTGVTPKADSTEEGEFLSRAESLEGYKICKSNDLVMNIMLAWNRGLGFAWQDGIVSPAYSVFSIKDGSSPRFLHYLLRSDEYIRYFKAFSTGVIDSRLRLYPESFGRLFCLMPSVEEQERIAAFLDHETAKIDALIAEQQRLIELLKEKRQAVISHAVTKGLNPNAPMKDSGVEWLGEVPTHWRVGSLGFYSSIDTGATPDRSNPEYWGGAIPWIKTGEVNYQLITTAEEFITEEGLKNSAARVAPAGTLLMAMYGQGVTRGRVAVLGIPAAYNQACAGIAVDNRLSSSYLQWYMTAAYLYVRDDGNETSQMNLSSTYISKIKVVIPPQHEQSLICKYLERKNENFARLTSAAERVVKLLIERRSALISAAVTGKIDVRDWQSPASSQVPKYTPQMAV